jgi:hypothetical protein
MKQDLFSNVSLVKHLHTNYKNVMVVKDLITVLVSANMSGTEELDLFVIRKMVKPRSFKNVKSLPVIYKSSKKLNDQ